MTNKEALADSNDQLLRDKEELKLLKEELFIKMVNCVDYDFLHIRSVLLEEDERAQTGEDIYGCFIKSMNYLLGLIKDGDIIGAMMIVTTMKGDA